MTKKITKIGVAVFIAASLFSSCREIEEPQEIIRPVRYVEAISTKGSYVRTFSGVAQSGTESRLSFRVPGTVQQIPVRLGDRVRAGQLLAALDPYDYELKLQQAEAALLQAKAQARNADVNYERTRGLYEKNSASKSELDSARMSTEAADADVAVLEKQRELARKQLSYTRILAPRNGAVAEVHVEINENIQAGAPIILLTSGSQIEVRISIPEILIAQIDNTTAASVKFDAVPDIEFSATVTEVGVRSTGMAATFPVTLLLDQPDPAVRAGMVATAAFRFELEDERVRFLIPSEAVGEDRAGRFVFIVEPQPGEERHGIIRRQPVQVGSLTPDGLEIFEGIEDGDLIVTAGISRITDGQRVKL